MTDIPSEARSTSKQLLTESHTTSLDHLSSIIAITADFTTSLSAPESEGETATLIQSYIRRFSHPFLISPEEEVNLLFVLALLRCCQSLTTDQAFRGVFSLLLDPELNISVNSLRKLTLEQVGDLFGLELQEEYALAPGIYGYRAAPTKSTAEEVLAILLSSCATLISFDCDDFHAYLTLLFSTASPTAIPSPITPSTLVSRLLKDFPEFNDTTTIDLSQPIAPNQQPAILHSNTVFSRS